MSNERNREEAVVDVAMQIVRLIDDSSLEDDAERAAAMASALAAFCKLKGFELIDAMNAFREMWNEVTVGEVKIQ